MNQLINQDTVTIKHTNYITTFSKTLRYPLVVEWWETRAKLRCNQQLVRINDFKADPQLPDDTNLNRDYVRSGYDRGHMCPDEDNRCQTQEVQDECFYFSNMAPQLHGFNDGIWKKLEIYTRDLLIKQDNLHLWAGSIGNVKTIGRVTVPAQCWKVIYISSTNQWLSYIFNNLDKPDKGINLTSYQVDLSVIKNLTGLLFE